MIIKNLEGERFGNLTVIKKIGSNKNHKIEWLCLCDCGKTTKKGTQRLTSGRDTSCGCLRLKHCIEATKISNTTHGQTNTKEYQVWTSMKNRCSNPKVQSYKRYGGRGIKVCERWQHSFENFLEDMGIAPIGASIDRIDVNGDYKPLNCRWASAKEQARNKTTTVMINYQGQDKPLIEWAEALNMNRDTLFCRVYRYNWPIKKALNTPVRKRKGVNYNE